MDLFFIEMIYSFSLSRICVCLAVNPSSATTVELFIGRLYLYGEVNSTHAIIMPIILSWEVYADIDLIVL
jgi:hypothetical protein